MDRVSKGEVSNVGKEGKGQVCTIGNVSDIEEEKEGHMAEVCGMGREGKVRDIEEEAR